MARIAVGARPATSTRLIYKSFVEFDSEDSSIILKCSMLTAAAITVAGGTLQSGATIDPILGVVTGANGGVQFDLSALDYTSLDQEGQMTFETDARNISAKSSLAFDSDGFDHVGSEYHLHWNSTDGVGTPYGRLYSGGAGDAIKFQMSTNDTEGSKAVHQQLADSNSGIAKVTLAWAGMITRLYVNGILVSSTSARAGVDAGNFKYLMVGALLSSVAANTSPYAYRNLVISNKRVTFAEKIELINILGVGDSFYANIPVLSAYESNFDQVVDGYFHRNNTKSDVDLSDSVSGSTIRDNSGNAIVTQLAGALAKNPYIVFYQGGTNDAILVNPQISVVDTDVKAQIDTILATAQHVIFINIPSLWGNGSAYNGDPDKAANVLAVNAVLNALPAWWNAANPSDKDRVHVVDFYTATGGANPIAKYFIESNYHPSGTGYALQGQLAGEKAASIIGLDIRIAASTRIAV